eukprot:COSAG05_NODE_2054_length_3633_cov_4.249010_1_plen_288_part_00
MIVASVDRLLVRLPLTERQQRILPPGAFRDICVVELVKVTLDTGEVGWGEASGAASQQGQTSDAQVSRVVGGSPAALANDDSVGIALQMALFDVLGKAMGVPVWQLLGTMQRQWVPLSYWLQSAAPTDWAAECSEAVAQGYTTCKLKARPWWDVVAQVAAVSKSVPGSFKLDLDFNETLQNVASATAVISKLERFDNVAFIESPIPQSDVQGNATLRQAVRKPLAMHFGVPRYQTAIKEVRVAYSSFLARDSGICNRKPVRAGSVRCLCDWRPQDASHAPGRACFRG